MRLVWHSALFSQLWISQEYFGRVTFAADPELRLAPAPLLDSPTDDQLVCVARVVL
jgi:hypothetical protein